MPAPERALITGSSSEKSDLWVGLFVDGDERDILRLTATDTRTIGQPQWSRAVLAANSFHAHYRFGRVYLDIQEGCSEAVFLFDAQLLLEQGASEDLLEGFIRSNLVCAHHFFDTVRREKGLYRNTKRRAPKAVRE